MKRTRGHWQVEGNAIIGGIGPIEGADAGDVGKTIDVRIHGTGHATVLDLKTPIVLWALGGIVVLFGLVVLRGWWRRR